jgi:hypothetical protein
MTRNNLIYSILGRRGCGKTHFTIHELLATYQKSHSEQRILIIDKIDHKDYRHVERISTAMLQRWSGGGMYRIYGEPIPAVFEAINRCVTNSLILFEDATRFFDGRTPDDVKDFLFDSKQKNVDLFFQFHGFALIPPVILRNTEVLTVFKCDKPERRRSDIVEYDMVEQTWHTVMNDPNPYAKKTIRLQ